MRASQGSVITYHSLWLGGEIRVLWENKSSKAFDAFIGDSVHQQNIKPLDVA